MWRTQGKLTHDFFILSRRHHHMLFVILFIFLLYFNLSSAKLHIFFQYANFFAIIFSFSSSLLAFTLLYRNVRVFVWWCIVFLLLVHSELFIRKWYLAVFLLKVAFSWSPFIRKWYFLAAGCRAECLDRVWLFRWPDGARRPPSYFLDTLFGCWRTKREKRRYTKKTHLVWWTYNSSSYPIISNTLRDCWAINGARTRDPQLGKLVLYQLSYYRNSLIIH